MLHIRSSNAYVFLNQNSTRFSHVYISMYFKSFVPKADNKVPHTTQSQFYTKIPQIPAAQ